MKSEVMNVSGAKIKHEMSMSSGWARGKTVLYLQPLPLDGRSVQDIQPLIRSQSLTGEKLVVGTRKARGIWSRNRLS